jgi:hypothetical protein
MSYKSGNIDISGLQTLEITDLTAAIDITGFLGAAGKLTLVTNASAYNVTLKHAASTSPAANILIPGGEDYILQPGTGVTVFKATEGWSVTFPSNTPRGAFAGSKIVSTTTYTPTIADVEKLLVFSHSSGCAVTIDGGIFKGGDAIYFQQAAPSGQVTLIQGSGVTLDTPDTRKTEMQWCVIAIAFHTPSYGAIVGRTEP